MFNRNLANFSLTLKKNHITFPNAFLHLADRKTHNLIVQNMVHFKLFNSFHQCVGLNVGNKLKNNNDVHVAEMNLL